MAKMEKALVIARQALREAPELPRNLDPYGTLEITAVRNWLMIYHGWYTSDRRKALMFKPTILVNEWNE